MEVQHFIELRETFVGCETAIALQQGDVDAKINGGAPCRAEAFTLRGCEGLEGQLEKIHSG